MKMGSKPKAESDLVYVIDAWDDDAQESYVRVFATADKAHKDLERWKAKREGHSLYSGIVKRRVI